MQRSPICVLALFATSLLSSSALAQEPVLTKYSPYYDGGGYHGHFGFDLDGLGDTAGLGGGDMIVGAPWEPPSPRNGRAYIIDGSNGQLLATLISPNSVTMGFFGEAVSSVPDATGDSLDDFAIGAPGEDGALGSQGRAYLYGRPSGPLGLPSLLQTFQTPNPAIVGHFGNAIAGIEDVDADGIGDVIIGAPGEDGGRLGSGRAYVFSGGTGVLLHSLVSPTPLQAAHFGSTVSSVPDVDGDGVDDVLIGEPKDKEAYPQGLVYLFSGATGSLIRTLDGLPELAYMLGFGMDVLGLPDLDGDGAGDVLISSPLNTGRVRLYSGATGGHIHTFLGDSSYGQGAFGSSLARAGDADGDGIDDILIGAPGEFDEGANNGRAYVYSGADFSEISKLEAPDPSPGGVSMTGNLFGSAVAGMPDSNGDGLPEYLIGAYGLDLGGYGRGSLYAFFCTTEVDSAVFPRAGIPANPSVFTATSPPAIGGVFTIQIDHATFLPAATIDLFLLGAAQINVPGPFGTLLVPLGASTLIYATLPGSAFGIPIPGDCSLVGAQLVMQGVSFDGATFAAANAIDFLIGTR